MSSWGRSVPSSDAPPTGVACLEGVSSLRHPGSVLSEFSAAAILLLQRIKVTYGNTTTPIRIRGDSKDEKPLSNTP